jgi:hypothetical protein
MYNKNLLNVLSLNAQGAGTVQSSPLHNPYGRGVKLVVDVTAVSGTPSLVVTLQGHDPSSGKNYTILASAAITAVGTTVLTVYPGLTVAANSVANDVLPIQWNVKAVISGTTPSVTATVGASLQV